MPSQWSQRLEVPREYRFFAGETTRNELLPNAKKAELAPRLFLVSWWLETDQRE
jgi:hypothetical protein